MEVTPERIAEIRVWAAEQCVLRPELVREDYKKIVEDGGGIYEPGLTLGCLVMFVSPQTGTILMLPEHLLTTENVREHIRKSNAEQWTK
jgi:hypothetical protein